MTLRRTSSRPILRAAIAAVLSAACISPAVAQEVRLDATMGLEEIIVTSRRVEESLQETPISVTAFRTEDLVRLNVTQIGDTARFTPGFTISAGPTGQNDGFFFIRGVGQVDLNPATDPGVGTYIDGVYLGRVTGASFDTLDIERVEVLRGPQGTLFGRNTMGGAVNVITRTPTGDTEGELRVFGGDYDMYGGRGRIDFPLGDSVAGTVAAMYRTQDGWGERADGTTFGDSETETARAKFVWTPSDAFSAALGGDWTRLRGTSQHQVLLGFNAAAASPLGVPMVPEIGASVVGDDIYRNTSSIDPRSDMDVSGVNLTLDWTGWAVDLKSITAYRELEQFATTDFDGSPYTFYDGFFDTDQDQFSQELQLSGDLGDTHWVLGGYYYTESAFHNNSISMGGNNGCLPVPSFAIPPGNPYPSCFVTGQPYATAGVQRFIRNNQQIDVDVEAIAAFAHAKIALTDQWSASLGVRWTEETKEQDYNFFIDNSAGVANFAGIPPIVLPTLSPNNPFLPPTVPTSYEETWSEVTPSASIEFSPVDEAMLYLSYAEGFKSGGFNGRPTPNAMGQFGAITPYDPERIETYELGVKSQLADNRVRLNAAAYYSEYSDIQLLVLGPSGFFETENAAESEIKGAEVELSALPVPEFQIDAALSYNDNEYTELGPTTILSGIDESDRLPLTPEWTYSLAATYTFEMGEGSSLALHADYSWRDEVFYGASNNPLEGQDSFGLLGARATYTFSGDQFSIALFGLNLTDEEYYSNGQDVVGPLGVAFAGVGAPRTWGLEAGYRFGD